MSRHDFMDMFMAANKGCQYDTTVTRIEFSYAEPK